MKSEAATVNDYLNSLPDDRKKAISAVRKVILKNLPKGIEEVMNWGMISYQIPFSIYPVTYNKQPLMFAALGSQKNYMVLHLLCIYMGEGLRAKFEADYKAAGKKLDAGQGCIRFKKLEDLPLDLIGKMIGSITVNKFIALFEKGQAMRKTEREKNK